MSSVLLQIVRESKAKRQTTSGILFESIIPEICTHQLVLFFSAHASVKALQQSHAESAGRTRTYDPSVNRSNHAVGPHTSNCYRAIFRHFHSPFRGAHFGLQCYAVRFSVIPCASLTGWHTFRH